MSQTLDLNPLRQVLSDIGTEPRRLIAVLQQAQSLYGYLPLEILTEISQFMRIPVARVYGVATFYSQFRLAPMGKHIVEVCNGTACNVKGAEPLIDELIAILGIRAGETTPDGEFTLVLVNCVGACGIAPAVVLDDQVHGKQTPKTLRKLIEGLRSGALKGKEKVENRSTPLPKTFLDRCCDRCQNTEGTPCPNFLFCRLEGQACHDDEDCKEYRAELLRLQQRESDRYLAHVFLCKGTSCEASNEAGIKEAFERELQKLGLLEKVEFIETGCQGLCELGPIVQITPNDAFYTRVKAEDVPELVEKHIVKGEFLARLCFSPEHRLREAIPFYAAQERRILSNTGKIDPENIDEYIAHDGYLALAKTLKNRSPEEVISSISASGLRGRGGGGFPTGKKWEIVRSQNDTARFIVCNADEGDPGAFMNRALLEGDPHRVLEGMIVGGYAIGASQGFIYCRAEYPLAIKRLEIAIGQATKYGLLGKNILGSGYDLELEVVQGAGAFVCGEETALIASLEGKRGTARNKPPYPAQHGFQGHPTLVNNVETYANVPSILLKGVEWFRSVGTKKCPGTKVFSLTGKVKSTGLIEVPLGLPLSELIDHIGGGAPEGINVKAVQAGGPSGGCIPLERFDTPIDYDSLKALGSIMGSGGLVVTDESTCMVAFARFFLAFTQHESCGKCIPCR
ncbi:MAG TPA: NAD(P)H-dependent oxidoreductase subunit E, partial [Chroococcales cyanobacterium]